MKQSIVPASGSKDYDWANDHVFVKVSLDVSEGPVTLVEDTLKIGLDPARQPPLDGSSGRTAGTGAPGVRLVHWWVQPPA